MRPTPSVTGPGTRIRILNLIDNQVRSLRKLQVIDSYKQSVRKGAYWSIRTNIADYGLPDAMNCPFDQTMQLGAVATRLKALDATLQEKIINWGYAVCDAALRKHVDEHCLHLSLFRIRPQACDLNDVTDIKCRKDLHSPNGRNARRHWFIEQQPANENVYRYSTRFGLI